MPVGSTKCRRPSETFLSRLMASSTSGAATADAFPIGAPAEYDYETYLHQVPGGMLESPTEGGHVWDLLPVVVIPFHDAVAQTERAGGVRRGVETALGEQDFG